MLKEQQKKEVEVSHSEDQQLIEEATPTEAVNQENPMVHGVSSDPFPNGEDIFIKLDIPWLPSDMQDTTAGKVFDSEKQNLQRTIKQYRHQMDFMQETNDGVILENKRLREDL